ncbi:MAG: hypothetical protein KBG40_09060 [Bacteroidales bacterium]|nr:hypothetical protein [Bacteroidales bacterium]
MHALSTQLDWSHLRQVIYLDDILKQDFYAEMCRMERWRYERFRFKESERYGKFGCKSVILHLICESSASKPNGP